MIPVLKARSPGTCTAASGSEAPALSAYPARAVCDSATPATATAMPPTCIDVSTSPNARNAIAAATGGTR